MAKTKAARTLSRPRIFTLHETADRLRPAEAFLDALAQSLPPGLKPGGRLSATSLGTAVLRAGPMLAHRPVDRDVWLNLPRLQPLDEGLGVVALAGRPVSPPWASAGSCAPPPRARPFRSPASPRPPPPARCGSPSRGGQDRRDGSPARRLCGKGA